MRNREKENMVQLLIAAVAILASSLAKGDTQYNLDQLTPLERQIQPYIYDVFSVCYFGVDPVYTQIPDAAVKYWEKVRSRPTHPLDFVITSIKVSRSHGNSLDVHCIGWLTLIDESGDGHITGTIYAEWDLALAINGWWPIEPVSDPGSKPVLTAFDESNISEFVKEYSDAP
jgi:hypothetical protein